MDQLLDDGAQQYAVIMWQDDFISFNIISTDVIPSSCLENPVENNWGFIPVQHPSSTWMTNFSFCYVGCSQLEVYLFIVQFVLIIIKLNFVFLHFDDSQLHFTPRRKSNRKTNCLIGPIPLNNTLTATEEVEDYNSAITTENITEYLCETSQSNIDDSCVSTIEEDNVYSLMLLFVVNF